MLQTVESQRQQFASLHGDHSVSPDSSIPITFTKARNDDKQFEFYFIPISVILFSLINKRTRFKLWYNFYVIFQDNRVHIGPKIEMRAITLGLDGAGKTSILFKLKQNEFVPTIPTIGFNVEELEYKNIKFTVWDVGGLHKIRSLWKHYYYNTQVE